MQTYSLGCTLKASFRKTLGWKTLLLFTTLFPQPCKVTNLSEFSSVSPTSLLKGFVSPRSYLVCQKSDMLLVWMSWYFAFRLCEKYNILPPEQSPPNGTENTHKCSYSCAAIQHSSRKSLHQGCAVFLSHLSKDCCNSNANARRRPHFTQKASDPLLLIITRLMQKNK